jgi:type IV pilus assembly protein PilM
MATNPLGNFDTDKLNIFKNPLKMFFPKKMLGIDIGTGAIKIVELSRWGEGKTLENYGEIKSAALYKEPFRDMEKGSYLLSNYFIARAIEAVLDEARIRTKEAIFTIPDFQCFSTSFELPPMSKAELADAVYYAAPQYIPLPISETTLDWKLIKGEPDKKTPLKIFLVAIPSQVVQDYQKIAALAGLTLYAVESEVMGLARALAKKKEECTCLVDMGMQSTTITIVYRGNVKKSYSFDFASSQLTHAVASVLSVENNQAEDLKIKEGLISSQPNVRETLYLLIDPLLIEIKRVIMDFFQEENKEVDAVYLTGGASVMPGLRDYVQETLKKRTEIPNCFDDLLYPPILGESLRKMAPRFSAATGVALGGLDV